MIELRTGLPGNGKTLSMVAEMAALLASWDKGNQDSRSIFTNIKGLALPVAPIPIQHVNKSKEGTETYVPDWDAMPDGTLVIFDEAQDFFPPRSSQSTAPPHVAWLNTHRHKGFDIIAITQHPKLVDPALRALTGKHKHYRRVFGMNRAIVYEWDGCSDNLTGMKNATRTIWNFPKQAYRFYKSAEIHTRQKFRLPLWLAIPFLGVALGLYFGPRAFATLSSGMQGKGLAGLHEDKDKTASGSGKAGAIAPAAAALPAPTVAASSGTAAASAPVSALLPKSAYAGCVLNAERCLCLTTEGELVPEAPQCRELTRRFGYVLNATTEKDHEKATKSPTTASTRPAPHEDTTRPQRNPAGAI